MKPVLVIWHLLSVYLFLPVVRKKKMQSLIFKAFTSLLMMVY